MNKQTRYKLVRKVDCSHRGDPKDPLSIAATSGGKGGHHFCHWSEATSVPDLKTNYPYYYPFMLGVEQRENLLWAYFSVLAVTRQELGLGTSRLVGEHSTWYISSVVNEKWKMENSWNERIRVNKPLNHHALELYLQYAAEDLRGAMM